MIDKNIKVTYTPEDEPYLGRELLFHFDKMISCCLENNSVISKLTHKIQLTELQKMASQVIPQSINISLSIRELIRQGYLFGAHVLKRSLIERVVILLYIHIFPDKINLWAEGWEFRKAPSLAKMMDEIKQHEGWELETKGYELTASLNSLVHGKPDSAFWGMVVMEDGNLGNAPSKMINSPKLCDNLCADIVPWLVVVVSMMCAYFPEIEA
jgi:hypothetical protein